MIAQITKTCLRVYNGREKLKNVITSSCSSQCSVVLSGVNCGIAVGGGMRLKREYLCSTANICSIPVCEFHALLVTEHTIACTAGVGMSRYRELCFEKATDLHPNQTSPSFAEVTRTAYCTKEALSRVPRLRSENADFAKVVVGRGKNPGLTPFPTRSPSSESQNWYTGQ